MSFLLPGLALTSVVTPYFLPRDVLYLTPFIAWSFATQWFIDEYHHFSSWTKLPPRIKAAPSAPDQPATLDIDIPARNLILAKWFGIWQPQGGLCAGVSTPLTWSSALFTLSRLPSSASIVRYWYIAGLALSVIHVAFGNGQFKAFRAIEHGGYDGKTSLECMDAWLNMHRKRLWLIDVPCWLCFGAAAIQAIRLQ